MQRYDRFLEPLFIILISGIVSVAVDLDHIIVLLTKGLPITLVNLATQAGRPLHIPLVVVSGIVCVISLSRFIRLRFDLAAGR